jgi:tRNA modification GTPase
LLNRLARREAAIVSPFAGTTRDVIEVHLDFGGLPVTLLDTAGIRPTDDPVEQEGMRRARERAVAADLVLWVIDGSERHQPVAELELREGQGLWVVENKADLQLGRSESRLQQNEPESGSSVNQLLTKSFTGFSTTVADPLRVSKTNTNESIFTSNEDKIISTRGISGQVDSNDAFQISAETGAGVGDLTAALARMAASYLGAGEPALVTRARHRQVLTEALDALRRAVSEPSASREDLLAEELRLASRALGRLTGRIDVEDVLDVIFRDFCIGK